MSTLPFARMLAAVAVLVPGTRGTELHLAPVHGLVLVKTGSFTLEQRMDARSLWNNGERAPVETPGVTRSSEVRLVVTDTYGPMDGTRVSRLERGFDDARRRTRHTGGPEEVDEERESPLCGLGVAFTYEAEEEAYTVAFRPDDARADEDLLVGLEQSLDFDAFLPDGEVGEDGTWTVDAAAVFEVLACGGDLKFDPAQDTPRDALIRAVLRDHLEGDVTCTFAGMRTVDGRALAVIAIAIDVQGEADAEESGAEQELGIPTATTREAQVELDLAGELRWNAEGGHFESIALAGEMRTTMDETSTAAFRGDTYELRVLTVFAGPLSLAWEAREE